MINNYIEYERLAFVENKLWWYKILHEKVLKSLKDYKIQKQDLIMDFGCGTGGLLEILLSHKYYNVKGIEVSDFAIDFCKKKILMSLRVI
jgi:2-polyprenyl-3-methyl-5-hydroxy-6-metoxy-1,4-benzoquinol methylase